MSVRLVHAAPSRRCFSVQNSRPPVSRHVFEPGTGHRDGADDTDLGGLGRQWSELRRIDSYLPRPSKINDSFPPLS
jgi:hypothetical protein